MRQRFLLGTLGIALFLAAWELAGQTGALGITCPPLSAVLAVLFDPARQPLFQRALGATLSAVATGYLLGLVLGVATASLAHLRPGLRAGLDRGGSILHAIPSVALAPLLILALGRQATPAALAGINTFFILYVATSSGLASSSTSLRDLMRALGASQWTRFWRIDLPSALPTMLSGLRMAAPGALIGAIIGEWFGAPRGIGVIILNAMQNFQIPLLWSAVLLTVAISLTLFWLLGAAQQGAASRYR